MPLTLLAMGMIAGFGMMRAGRAAAQSPPPPQLAITPSGTNLMISWPITNGVGFYLQERVNLGTGGWAYITLPQPPVILNGKFVVTVPKSTNAQHNFYRLSQ
jgi:hypothetical protein